MNIECERCDTAMKTVFYEGVAIKLCMNCKGILLSEEKLAAIEESLEFDIPDETAVPRNGPEIRRNCPECKLLMKKRKHGKIITTMIDFCENCSGIWLDKGELASIQLGFEIADKNKSRNQFRRL